MGTRKEALGWLTRLDLPEVFRRLYSREPVPPQIAAHFRCPEELFDCPDDKRESGESRVVPLFVDTETGRCVLFDPTRGDFVEAFPGEPVMLAPRFRSWQQYLAERMIRIAESGATEEELQAVAEETGFGYFTEVRAFLDACLDHPTEEYQARRKTCLKCLPA